MPPRLATAASLPLTLSLLLPAALAAQPPPIERLQADDAAAGDLFGCALDLDLVPGPGADGGGGLGVLLVGSLEDDDLGTNSGSAYVYELLPGAGGWIQSAKLLAPESAAGDRTGFAVALGRSGAAAGDRALLGAPGAGPGGAVHVYRRGPDGWFPTARLATGEAGAGLGSSVLFDGRDVLAGAPTAGAGGRRAAGAVVRFGPNGGVIRRYQAAEPQDEAGFGWALAKGGGGAEGGESGVLVALVAVGAPWEDTPITDAGAVHLFTESGFLEQRVVAPDGGAFDAFGYSVAIDGARLAVGAPRAAAGAGVVYVFARGPFAYELEARFTGAPGDQLGTDVALTGGTLVAGARREDRSRGAVRLYRWGETGWTEAGRVQPSESGPGDEVGIAVALSGGALAVGAYRDDGGGTDAGAVYAEVVDLALPQEPPDPPEPDRPIPERPPTSPVLSAVLAVAGIPVEGGVVTYTLTIANDGDGPLRDGPGDEVVIPFPAQLVPVAGRADTGAVRIDPPDPSDPSAAGGWVAWNGMIAAGGSVTIEIDAMILFGARGSQVATQATVTGPDGTEVASAPPGATAPGPTVFTVLGPPDIPALSGRLLALLAVLVAAGGFALLRR